jgi:hypothetical protein
MDIIERLENDKPSFHWGGTRRWNAAPHTLREIQRSVSKGMRTLETGCGASTVVFAARGAQHTIVSPTHDEHERVRIYLGEVGIDSSQLTFEVGFSDEVLPRLCNYPGLMAEWEEWYTDHSSSMASVPDGELFRPKYERYYDYLFLDGAHAFPYPVVDWHYSMKVLKIGGRLLLDDIPIPAVACVFRYLVSDPSWKLVNIYDNRAAAFDLVAEPAPEDWTLQAYNRYPYFGFAPLPKRAYLSVATQVNRFKRQLGDRMPALRTYWQQWHSSS